MKPICIVDGCQNPNCSQGMCFKHYRRWQRHGMTDLPTRPTRCSVDGCGRKHRCIGLCELHYDRMRRLGTTDLVQRPDYCTRANCGKPVIGWGLCEKHYRAYRIDTTTLPCSVENCGLPARARGWCKKHYQRWYEKGAADWERTIGYAGTHGRIRRLLGAASDWLCIDCGSTGQEWSYDHEDPDEMFEQAGVRGIYAVPFSSDPNHYDPRCRPCHRMFDGNYKRLASSDELVTQIIKDNLTRETMTG